MLQLLAKAEDIFTGGREYYSHPNYKADDKPIIIHQSSATGMQAIPTTGIAQGIQYKEQTKADLKKGANGELPIVICSLGDASITEGEVSEAFQFAVLKQLPIIYLIQDNNWGISVSAEESRAMNAFEFAAGFKGMNRMQVDGSDFEASYEVMKHICDWVRQERKPYLVHAQVPLLGHHTSGVRKDFYRSEEDLETDAMPPPRSLRGLPSRAPALRLPARSPRVARTAGPMPVSTPAASANAAATARVRQSVSTLRHSQELFSLSAG